MRTKTLLIPVAFLILGAAGGYWGHSFAVKGDPYINGAKNSSQARSAGAAEKTEIGEKGFHFISPLLDCGDQSALNGQVSDEIEKKVSDFIDSEKELGHVSDASMYYKDLSNGPWALVNGDLQSFPGSLLKVPLAFSAYDKEEGQPGFLNQQVEVSAAQNFDANQSFKPANQLQSGHTYTIKQLIDLMLVYSDNSAALTLTQVLGNDAIAASYDRLGIQTPIIENQNYKMNVRTYASFFRILYNASYISKVHSEEVLDSLSKATFKDGIVAGVPAGTVVAHKFGERTLSGEGTSESQLHDCGIVYKASSPYLLCIMTHGSNLGSLSKVIAGISKIVYNIVDKSD